MKTSNPYGSGMTFKSPPETITSEVSKAGGKAKARYPHKPITTNQTTGGGGGAVKHRAYTPGGPTGS